MDQQQQQIPAQQPSPAPKSVKPRKIKQARQEMWWIILAKSKTLRFFAVSCEFILFLGGLWITFTVNDPESKTWLAGNINMIFLTIMGWAVDAAMPEAWLHVVIQHVQKERGQLGWSKFVAICISVLFIGNIVYSVFTGGDTSGGVSGTPADITGWILLVLVILRISVGFVYITVRQCQEWIKRQNPETATPPALLNLDSWSLVALAAYTQQETYRQLTELASAQSQKINLVDLQLQRLFSEVQELQEIPEPAVDYQKLALALGPLFEQRMNASVSAIKMTIIEEVKATLPLVPEKPQIEARARSQSQQKQRSRTSSTQSPEDRLEAAFTWLVTNSIRVSGRALATRAHVNRGTANEWLQKRQEEVENGSDVVDSEPEE